MLREIEEFTNYLLAERGLSLHTIEAYKRDNTNFSSYLTARNILRWQDVQQQHVVDYLTSKQPHFATSSLCRTLIGIKVFFRFLKRENLISKNTAALLETPKLWQLIPDVLSQDEMEKILSLPEVSSREGACDRAILEVLYGSGLRVSELCQLKICDVDDTFIRIYGKGGKERMVPLGSKALEAIDHYLSFRDGDQGARGEFLFLTARGKCINRIQVWNLVKKYAKVAGIKKNIFPHTFRHTFATHLLDNGADLRVIQEMLGHASIGTTDRYTHASSTHIQEAFYQFHPR